MNKEIINKYKAEFDHWLNGGELLALYPRCEGRWINASGITWRDDTAEYVINDKYVEYRKALAEGKTIQYNGSNLMSDGVTFTGYIENYSIKPDEPKFKVGDYVINEDCGIELITKKTGNDYCTRGKGYTVASTLLKFHKLWTLEEASDDEWVLAWFNNCLGPDMPTSPLLMHAHEAREDTFDNVVPYIGQTPKELGLEG